MIAVILDTNVVVQSVIGSPTSTSAQVLDAYFAGRFRIVHSTATVDELLEVLRPDPSSHTIRFPKPSSNRPA